MSEMRQYIPRLKNENQILRLINQNGIRGITQKEIKTITKLHRDTINVITARLQKKNLIEVKREGKYTKYVSKRPLTGVPVQAWLFAKKAEQNFLGSITIMPITKDVEFYDSKNKLRNTHFFEPKFDANSDLEKRIFEFSNRIGGLATFVIIHGLNQLITKNNKGMTEYEKHDMVYDWIETIFLSILTPTVLIGKFKQWFPDFEKRKQISSYYEYNEKTMKKISDAFARLYPSINYQLNEIITDLPSSLVEDAKNRILSYNSHADCKHSIKQTKIGKKIRIKCENCGLEEILSIK